jgi:hypothetical protein
LFVWSSDPPWFNPVKQYPHPLFNSFSPSWKSQSKIGYGNELCRLRIFGFFFNICVMLGLKRF